MKVDLICPPFHVLGKPSIGITQLKSVIDRTSFSENINVRLFYLNHDFGTIIPPDIYDSIANGFVQQTTGIGEWFFRNVAFPNIKDNSEEYFARYGSLLGKNIYSILEPVRENLKTIIDQYILSNNIHLSDIVGLTSMFSQNTACFAFAERLKKINPEVIIIMGGSNCEYPMGIEILKFLSSIDYVFSGSALKNFPIFISNCINKNNDANENINGIFSKINIQYEANWEENKKSTEETPDKQIFNMWGDKLDINEKLSLDYQSFIESYYQKLATKTKTKPSIFLETSKGCSWGEKVQCTFCGLNSHDLSFKMMKNEIAIDYIGEHIKKYSNDIEIVNFVDNSMPKNYLEKVFPKIEIPEHISFFCEIRPDFEDEEIELFIKNKIFCVQPGIESLYTPVLKLMKKGTTLINNIRLLKQFKIHDIHCLWNLLIGFPEEPEEVYVYYINNLPSFYHLPPPFGLFRVRFDRYSHYYNNQELYKLELKPLDYYHYIYPIEENSLLKFVYYFYDRNVHNEYNLHLAKWVDKLNEIIEIWISRWNGDENDIPQLYIDNNSQKIVDSRSKKTEYYELNEISKKLLLYLNKPVKLDRIYEEFSTFPYESVKKELDNLVSQKFIITDISNKFYSLVS